MAPEDTPPSGTTGAALGSFVDVFLQDDDRLPRPPVEIAAWLVLNADALGAVADHLRDDSRRE